MKSITALSSVALFLVAVCPAWAQSDPGIQFTVEGVSISGDADGDGTLPERSLCDDNDDRVPSSDPRVGRLNMGSCTVWLIGNGAALTAGHCTRPNGTLSGNVQFNVPPSTPDGRPMPANIIDRYPIISSSLVFEDDGEGHDWAVFQIGANTNGLFAHDVQGFFKVTTIVPSNGSTLRVTGFGLDNSPAGTGGPNAECCDTNDDDVCENNCNSSSRTQQTDTGRLDDLDGSRIEHQVDTLPANSGGPVIREDNGFTIGIHTHGGCDLFTSNYDNGGTWFGYAPLFHAINSFTPAGTLFVDLATPDSVETGTLLFPIDTVAEAVANVPSGGTIRIFSGSYTIASLGADGRAMRLEPLLGPVVIGN